MIAKLLTGNSLFEGGDRPAPRQNVSAQLASFFVDAYTRAVALLQVFRKKFFAE
jgi:hypothetical protein